MGDVADLAAAVERRDTDVVMRCGATLAEHASELLAALTGLLSPQVPGQWTVIGFYEDGHPVIVGAVPGHLTVSGGDGDLGERFGLHVISASAELAADAARRLVSP
jgi:hypothetical protein